MNPVSKSIPCNAVAIVAALLACLAVSDTQAQSLHFTANVIRTTPVHQTVTETLQQCVTETVAPTEKGSSGAIVGAIVGGVVGNQIGSGSGKDVATGVGAITGAVIGDNMQNAPRTQQRCTPIQNSRSIIVGYDVTWEYLGQRVTQRMNRDPGQYVTVSVTAN
jgi:uncharacterized protein YcfJ